MKNKILNNLTGILAILFISLVPHVSVAQSKLDLLLTSKKCKYIENSEYQLFSNIDATFPVIKALGAQSSNGCVKVVGSINKVFSAFFKIMIGIASVSAVINIAVAGIKTILSESGATGRSEWKKTLRASLEGLLIALSAWLILNTINDRTLKEGLNFGAVKKLAAGIDKGEQAAIVAANAQDALERAGIAAYKKTEGRTAAQIGASNAGNQGTGGINGKFTNPAWEQATREAIQKYGLDKLSPADAKEFFPNSNGTPTTDDWMKLMGQVVQRESGFNANDTYPEPKLGYNSVGLFQLSAVDKEVAARGYSEADLKDPYKNIDVGVQIMKNRIESGGSISQGTSGGAAYWSVLRDPSVHTNGQRGQIINALNQ